MIVAVGVATLLWLNFGLTILTSSELSSKRRLPRPPIQPTEARLTCTYCYKGEGIKGIDGDWTLTASDGGCTFRGVLLPVITATPVEMLSLSRRPKILFQVARDGRIRKVMVSRSSGSPTLDQKAVRQVQAQQYGRHDCGICEVLTVIDIEYAGPVWIRDTIQ